MVCKEEVFMWFKALNGSKRIDVMCGLLNMCCSLELRFCGTCLEDLGRKDFYCFREEELKANNLADISKISNIIDSATRRKLVLTLSLLHSSNVACSDAIYKILTEEMKIESMASAGVFSDAKIVNEILLLLTMAQYHPAFTFEQQTFLSQLCASFEKHAKEIMPQPPDEEIEAHPSFGTLLTPVSISTSVTTVSPELVSCNTSCHRRDQYLPSNINMFSDSQQRARIASLRVKSAHNKKSHIRIRVIWCTGKITTEMKTPHEIAVFHQKLVQLFPQEAQASSQEKHIPRLPDSIAACSSQEVVTDNLVSVVTDYIWQLSAHLPTHVLESDFVVNFFQASGHNRNHPSRGNRNADTFPTDTASKNTRLRSLTIYNSHISDGSSGNRSGNEGRQRNGPQNAVSQPATRKFSDNGSSTGGQPASPPLASPLLSPLSSPYVSPPASGTSSRSASPWTQRSSTNGDRHGAVIPDGTSLEQLLMKEQLHDYWDQLRHYRMEDLQNMAQEDLECLGLLKDAASKLKKMLDNIRVHATLNGMAGHFIPRPPVPTSQAIVKGGVALHQASNESSPVCSEYSSPPPSPSPPEACHRHSPASSSSEEIQIEKGTPSKSVSDSCKITEECDQSIQDQVTRRTDDITAAAKDNRDNNRHSAAVALPLGYNPGVPQLPPSQAHKPSFLPIQCRANHGPHHLGPGAVIFDNQFSRVPLPSALTYLPHSAAVPPRSHTGTPERGLTSSAGLPITTICPFPIVTSGCTTVPSPTCSIATYKSCTSTAVTNSVITGNNGNRQLQKGVSSSQSRDPENGSLKSLSQQQSAENCIYAHSCAYLLPSPTVTSQQTPSSCSCLCTTNSVRPSPVPSPSISPGSAPPQQTLPVSLPYIGLPYMFPHSLPFLQAHSSSPANGFISPPSLPAPNPGPTFGFTLPNGMSGIPPELIYGGQAFSLPSPSPQGNPSPSVSQGFANNGNFSQAPVSAVAVAHSIKTATCYNCGKPGHRGPECKEQSIDEMSKPAGSLPSPAIYVATTDELTLIFNKMENIPAMCDSKCSHSCKLMLRPCTSVSHIPQEINSLELA